MGWDHFPPSQTCRPSAPELRPCPLRQVRGHVTRFPPGADGWEARERRCSGQAPWTRHRGHGTMNLGCLRSPSPLTSAAPTTTLPCPTDGGARVAAGTALSGLRGQPPPRCSLYLSYPSAPNTRLGVTRSSYTPRLLACVTAQSRRRPSARVSLGLAFWAVSTPRVLPPPAVRHSLRLRALAVTDGTVRVPGFARPHV